MNHFEWSTLHIVQERLTGDLHNQGLEFRPVAGEETIAAAQVHSGVNEYIEVQGTTQNKITKCGQSQLPYLCKQFHCWHAQSVQALRSFTKRFLLYTVSSPCWACQTFFSVHRSCSTHTHGFEEFQSLKKADWPKIPEVPWWLHSSQVSPKHNRKWLLMWRLLTAF